MPKEETTGSVTTDTVVKRISDIVPAKNACLVMLYGPDLGRRYILTGSSMVIGRAESCDIYVDRDSVSRSHARVDSKDQKYVVADLGSTNGTYVNDVPVEDGLLMDGDLLRTGDVIFKFLSRDNLENVYHEEVYRLATTDGLTMASNRRYFQEMLEREISRSRRYRRPLSLAICDLDRFKGVNDTYGHLAGDHVLKQLASIIMANVRREDVFARIGGEEFGLLLPETNVKSARSICEKLRVEVAKTRFVYDNRTMPVTCSFGVAELSKGITRSKDLMKEADIRLYEAKDKGRNRVVG